MRRCIYFFPIALVLTWAAPSFGQEAEEPSAPPEGSEEPTGEPEEEAPTPPVAPEEGSGDEAAPPAEPEAAPGEESPPPAETEEEAPAESPPTAEVEDPFAEPEAVAPESGDAPAEPVAEDSEEIPPPPLETAAPELGAADEEGDDAEDAEGEDDTAENEERSRVGTEEQWSDSLPFRNTILTYENIFSVVQLNREYDQSYNPYYAMGLSIKPRWYFTDEFSVRLRLDIEGELTDADSTTDYHETRVGDLILDLVYDPVYTIPTLDVSLGLGIRAQFPTSLESQAESRYMGLGADLRLGRVFDVLDGLVISYMFRYMKYLNRYTTLQRDTNPRECMGNDPACLANWQLGDPARSHGFFNWISISLAFLREQWRPMNFTIAVFFMNYLTYELPEYNLAIMGGEEVPVEHIANPVNHSAYIWYIFELGLDITDYLGISLGASTFSPQLSTESTYREPFFNRYTRIYVDLSIDIERVVAAIRR